MRAGFDLVAFDLDGTLVDSAPDLSHCLGLALGSLGRTPPTLTQTRSWIGGGVELLVRRALAHSGPASERDFTDAFARFHTCYRDHLFVASRVYDGIEQVLEAARGAGISMCCVTNKRYAYALELLELAGLARFFAFTIGGDSFPEKKPHPRPLIEAARRAGVAADRCALVGDSAEDWRAALAAGFRFFWAAYGYGTALGNAADTREVVRIARCEELIAALGLPC